MLVGSHGLQLFKFLRLCFTCTAQDFMFTDPQALVPRVIKIGIAFTPTFSEPRSATSAAIGLTFFADATFGTYGDYRIDKRGRTCFCGQLNNALSAEDYAWIALSATDRHIHITLDGMWIRKFIPAFLHVRNPSSQVCSNFPLTSPAHLPNHAPPRPQQLCLPDFFTLPHLGHPEVTILTNDRHRCGF